MNFQIRTFRQNDKAELYKICLLTGDSGRDASGIYDNVDILPDFYVGPYLSTEPESCFVLEVDNKITGYIIGTENSVKFRRKSEKFYFPEIREKYSSASFVNENDKRIYNLIKSGYLPNEKLSGYPAHLHIDILPAGQGKGFGKLLLNHFSAEMKKRGVKGVHLEVGKRNMNAVKFYRKSGFRELFDLEYSFVLGVKFLSC